ncbi:hypothetical protein SAMN02745130_02976 [Thiothrix eikelboomii]|uniref:Uncharacterized protein n=1 Tax=Thiothrix eikelboomii TaxID=92487 RepID=A0A1T4XGC0_9GAMM|nr:hypothetical protein SAMN02745130_02976 [Thiothrix eikelboomii]
MLNFFSSMTGILMMTSLTILFILGFLGYLFWKLMKLSNHKPQPGEKSW